MARSSVGVGLGAGGVGTGGSDLVSFSLSPCAAEFGLAASVISASLAMATNKDEDEWDRIDNIVHSRDRKSEQLNEKAV